MASPDVLLLLVHYNNTPNVVRFIRHVAGLAEAEGRRVEVALADNSGNWDPAADFPVRVTVAEQRGNVGYLTGCAHAYAAWQERHSGTPQWVGVVNTDLTFAPGWTSFLDRAEGVPDVGVVAPDIRLANGIRQNPHLVRRPSRLKFRLYIALHRHPLLYALPLWMHGIKQWVRTRWQSGARWLSRSRPLYVYAAHGSAMFFPPQFFARGGTLFYHGLMYGEEVFIAEQVRALGLQVLWCPNFRVTHAEHGVTGQTRREWRRMRQLESLEYLWRRFFRGSDPARTSPSLRCSPAARCAGCSTS